jgi:N-acetylglucosaminyl-diphospho-decaprenol L-rhamnosyltransferase
LNTAISSGKIYVSIVSHLQRDLLGQLLEDFARIHSTSNIYLFITLNVPEEQPELPLNSWLAKTGRVQWKTNTNPIGFGSNHNQAFRTLTGLGATHADKFCVLNPDIRFTGDPFSQLAKYLDKFPECVPVAPEIFVDSLHLDDAARFRPTFWRLTKKLLFKDRGRFPPHPSEPYHPDWMAGMFLMLNWRNFGELRGFDEKYFMYYEDADLSARAIKLGLVPTVFPDIQVVHNAQRASHRDLKRAWIHLKSMLRFLTTSYR